MIEAVLLSHETMALTDTRVTHGTPTRILDAAFDAVADFGLSRLTMEDVAARAGLSRQTLYRYFPAKDDLLTALVLREEERFLDGVRAAFATEERLEEAIAEAVTFVLRYARRHPLLDRLLSTDPDALLPYLTTKAQPMIARAAEVLLPLLRERAPNADPGLLRWTADASTRLLISYSIDPPAERPERIAESLARILGAALGTQRKEKR